MMKYLAGTDGVAPIVVRLVRGAIEIGALAGLSWLAVEVSNAEWGDLGWIVTPLLAGIVFIEGVADQYLDPTQNRKRPSGSNMTNTTTGGTG